VQQLRRSCPDLGVLAASREPLGVAGEQVWRLDPLSVGDSDACFDAANVAPAVQLFVERARAARSSFALDDDTCPTIIETCRRLDGLPLAIELAAARVAVLSPSDILQGLDDRFRMLRSRDPTTEQRQQTMRAVLDWSRDLLDLDERATFARLGIFGNSFTVAAAAAAADVSEADVADVIWSLADKSLLVVDTTGGITRYRMLDTVRAYARTLSDRDGEATKVAGRLARWYLARLGPDRVRDRSLVSDIRAELDNMRPLVEFAAADDVELAQQLVAAISVDTAFQPADVSISGLSRYVDELTAPTSTRVGLLTWLAALLILGGQVSAAEARLREASLLRSQVGAEPPWGAGVDYWIGVLLIEGGGSDAAINLAESALSRGDLSAVRECAMHNLIGEAATDLGDMHRSVQAFQAALERALMCGDDVNLAADHFNLAFAAVRIGDLTVATQQVRQGLTVATELGSSRNVAEGISLAASVASARGHCDTAARLLGWSSQELQATGYQGTPAERRAEDEVRARTRRELGNDAYEQELAAGRTLDVAGSFELAHSVLMMADDPRAYESVLPDRPRPADR